MEKIKSFLIDTDVLIDFLRGLKEVSDFLFRLRKEGKLLISVINVAEIYSGKEIKNPAKRKIINQFLNEFEIISLDENLAKKAGKIRLDYQLPFADAIVAATTINTRSILITRNIKHFSKIRNLKLKSP